MTKTQHHMYRGKNKSSPYSSLFHIEKKKTNTQNPVSATYSINKFVLIEHADEYDWFTGEFNTVFPSTRNYYQGTKLGDFVLKQKRVFETACHNNTQKSSNKYLGVF